MVYRFSEVGSTMDEARSLAATACPAGSIVIASHQTHGRGRVAGREWKTRPGDSLLMTLVLGEKSASMRALPLRAGLGACLFAEEMLAECSRRRAESDGRAPHSPVFRIKWPNDLVYAQDSAAAASGQWRKVCGILCESANGRALVGVGFNLAQTPDSFPADVAGKAGSMCMALGVPPEDYIPADGGAESLALALASSIEAACSRLDWHSQITLRLLGLGEDVRIMEGHPDSGRIRRGLLEGIDDEGRILLRDAAGVTVAFASAEFTGFTVSAGTDAHRAEE